MPEFMILRNAAAQSTASGFESFGPAAATRDVPIAPPEPRIETHDMSIADAVSLQRDPAVAAVAIPMPVQLITPLEGDAGAAAADAWGVAAVKANASAMTGAGVTVAVLDTGIDKAHPAFAGVEVVEKDFTGSGNGDRQGHGTHCAGTIFGRDVGGKRIGIAPGVNRALIGKVLGDNGGGSSDMIFRGIQWAIDEGAQVVSMSLGFDFPGAVERMQATMPTQPAVSSALEAYRSNLRFFDALMNLIKMKAPFGPTPVVVAATGNESARKAARPYTIAASLPAASNGVISVGALGRAAGGLLDVAPFSNTMPQVAAPGVDILSAKPGPGGALIAKSGTSMACPHVAGVAALWWQSLSASGAQPTADLVAHHVMARCRTDVLVPTIQSIDRGVGIVTAP